MDRKTLEYCAVFAVALISLCGCSASGMPRSPNGNAAWTRAELPIPPEVRAALPRPDARLLVGASENAGSKGGVYVSQFYTTLVGEYAAHNTQNQPPFCQISGIEYVDSIGVDPKGTLYVPQGSVDVITTYARDCGAQGTTLSDPYGQPEDVAFNQKTGAVYVSNLHGPAMGAAGSISVYPKGATSPSGKLSNHSVYQSNGVAVDKSGNVFESYLSSGSVPGIVEYKGGKMPGKLLKLNGLQYPDGLEFDKAGNLIVVDVTSAAAFVFAPRLSGGPTSTIALKGYSIQGKLDQVYKNLFVSDQQNGTLDVYAYPAGTYEYSVTNGLTKSNDVIGAAVDPPAPQ